MIDRMQDRILSEKFAEDVLQILCDNENKLKGADAEKTLYLILQRSIQLGRDLGEIK